MTKNWLGSVRARVTVGSVLVVSLALAVIGIAIVRLIAAALVEDAQNVAEVQARNLAIVVEAGRITPLLDVDAAGNTILQVVGESGQVVAASPQLADIPPLSSASPGPGQLVAQTVRVESYAGNVSDYRVVGVGSESPSGSAVVFAGVSLAEAERVLARLNQLLLIGLALVLPVVAAVAWLVTRRALRPVEAIRTEVDKLTDQELDRRVPVPAHADEIQRLALTMNRMLDRLQAATDKQRAFIADASHELRSPLASLQAQLQVAVAHPDGITTEELAAGALEDTERLESLAAELLQLARLDAGSQSSAKRVDLAEAVRQTLARRRSDRVSLEFTADGAVFAWAVPGAVEQIVTNLVDNAERHAASAVSVAVVGAGGVAEIRVSDDGPGIPTSERERVFERFVRLDSARDRQAGGTGLGLAIARELARKSGGDVQIADSERGAVLRVILPAAHQFVS